MSRILLFHIILPPSLELRFCNEACLLALSSFRFYPFYSLSFRGFWLICGFSIVVFFYFVLSFLSWALYDSVLDNSLRYRLFVIILLFALFAPWCGYLLLFDRGFFLFISFLDNLRRGIIHFRDEICALILTFPSISLFVSGRIDYLDWPLEPPFSASFAYLALVRS